MLRERLPRTIVVLAIAAFWSGTCVATDNGLKSRVENVLAEENLSGVAWTLVRENGDSSVDAAGLQDNFNALAFSPETRFHVGSLTKALLATGILRLATEGRIDIDEHAVRYLPPSISDNVPAAFSEVTVRHLLDHTAGLNDAHMWQMFSERAAPDDPLISAFPDPMIQLRVRSQPGARFSYSNMGYTLLGMVIEFIVGTRYETYLDTHVLAPLNMRNTTFAYTTQEGDSADSTLAWGHVDDGSRYPASPVFLRPAAQLTTNAADLSHFATFLMGDGRIDGQVFVNETLLRSRGRPFETEAANAGLIAGYALGLGRRDRHGVVGFCHGGNIVGFFARLCVFPEEKKAFAYSVNTDSETANYGRLDALMISALEITQTPQPKTGDFPSDILEWRGRYVLSPNRFQSFAYLDTVFGALKVSKANDELTIASWQTNTRTLRPLGEHLYSADNRATMSHVLLRDTQDGYLFSDGFRTYKKVSTAYLVTHWVSVLLGVAGLMWILIAGCVCLFRHRSRMYRRAETPAFVAVALLFVPVPFFATQSFMALGDVTVASALLAAVTLLLPVGMCVTMIMARRHWKASWITRLHSIAAGFVLQWCAVLATAGMLPFRLWA